MMNPTIRLWLLAISLALSALAGAQQTQTVQPALQEASVPADAFSKTPAPEWVMPAESMPPAEKGPVVIRLADTQFLVGSSSTVFVRRAVQVNDNAALGEIGQLAITFVPDYQKAQLHRLRILRGNEVLERRDSVNIRFLQRESRFEAGVYSGVVVAALLIEDVRVGDTLEYEYSVSGVNPVFQGKFADSASWSGGAPVSRRKVVLNHPAKRDIRFRFLGDNAPQVDPVRERVGENVRLIWAQDRVPAVRMEGHYPRAYVPVSYLQFSEYRDWNEVARWATGLFGGEVVIDNELAGEINRIKGLGAGGRDAQVSAALQFVQNEIRYFSVSLGESSHRPGAPQVVMRRRFGDCKDKSWLLIAMLRELGINARPVLVSLDPFSPVRPALPSPILFDHVIVRVELDGRDFYLDPTRIGQVGRLARMGQVHEGADVLVVAQDSNGLSVLKSENVAELFSSEITEQIVVQAFGKPATFTIRSTSNGLGAEILRMFSKTRADDMQRALTDEVLKRYPGAALTGTPEYQDDVNDNRFSIVTRYNLPNVATENRDAWTLNFVPTNLVGVVGVPPSVQRSSPLGIGAFPYNGRYSLNVQLPSEVSAMFDPASTRVRNKAFEFNMSERFRGNNASFEMRLQTLMPSVSPGELDGYVADVRKMLRAMGGTVIVPKRLLTAAPTGGLRVETFERRLTERLEERAKRYTATINEGRIKGKDLAAAHADRGFIFNDLGKTNEALKDMEQALVLDDGNPEFVKGRAVVLFKRGELQKSAAEYTRALTLGADPYAVYYRRGIINFYLGRLEDALTDFEQSMGITDAEERLFHALWYAWTSQFMGKALPDALRAEFDANAGGAWPRPALAMFTGKLAPEDILKAAEAKSGDERLMTLCEAYFYIGQYYMIRKDLAKAREYFEKARATNVLIYTEHEAAKLELDRLAAAKP